MSDKELTFLLKQLRSLLPDLRARYGVRSLGIFGSYVRGEQGPHSDLDLLVEFDDCPLSLFDFVRLENEIGDALNLKVDLVEKRVLKPYIGQHILAEVVAV